MDAAGTIPPIGKGLWPEPKHRKQAFFKTNKALAKIYVQCGKSGSRAGSIISAFLIRHYTRAIQQSLVIPMRKNPLNWFRFSTFLTFCFDRFLGRSFDEKYQDDTVAIKRPQSSLKFGLEVPRF